MRKIAQDTAVSLREEPKRWEIGEFRATRDDGLTVWIANGYFGLSITPPNGPEYGGVSFTSVFFGWATPWRRAVMSAVRDRSWGPYV